MEQAKQVWVAFSSTEQQFHIAVSFSEGMTAQQAIDASGLAAQTVLPEVLQLGVFGSRIDADTVLQAGDRVEIYRPTGFFAARLRRISFGLMVSAR